MTGVHLLVQYIRIPQNALHELEVNQFGSYFCNFVDM